MLEMTTLTIETAPIPALSAGESIGDMWRICVATLPRNPGDSPARHERQVNIEQRPRSRLSESASGFGFSGPLELGAILRLEMMSEIRKSIRPRVMRTAMVDWIGRNQAVATSTQLEPATRCPGGGNLETSVDGLSQLAWIDRAKAGRSGGTNGRRRHRRHHP
jgi:hypothetical protein